MEKRRRTGGQANRLSTGLPPSTIFIGRPMGLMFSFAGFTSSDLQIEQNRSGMVKAFRESGAGLFMLRAGGLIEVVNARVQSCISPQRVQAVQKICISLTHAGRLETGVGSPCLESV